MRGLVVNTSQYERKGRERIVLFIRNEKNERIAKEVRGFPPHFFIFQKDIERSKKYFNSEEIKDISFFPVLSLHGEDMAKVELYLSRFVVPNRDALHKRTIFTFEADVPYVIRYLINNRIVAYLEIKNKEIIPIDYIHGIQIRIMFLDLEALAEENTEVDPYDDSPICSITLYDNYTKRKYCLYVGEKYEVLRLEPNTIYIRCKDEADLLITFFDLVRLFDIDVLTGWNIDGYDIPKIIYRSRVLRLDYNVLSPMKKVYFDKKRKCFVIKGRQIFDMRDAYRGMKRKEMAPYTLDNIAREELGEGKIKLPKWITDLWKEDKSMVLKYNIQDVDLMLRIDEKMRLFEYYESIRQVVGCNYDSLLIRNQIVDISLLRYSYEKVILPTSLKEKGRHYEGGLVYIKKSKIYDYVVHLDFRSMYPSFIMGCNISPETWSSDGEIILNDTLRFKKSPVGVIPKAVEYFFEARLDKERKRDKALEEGNEELVKTYNNQIEAIKTILNAFYGVMAYKRFRLFFIEGSEATALVGRQEITFTKLFCKENNLNLIYMDTDGIFLAIDAKSDEEAYEKGLEIEIELNKAIQKWSKQFNLIKPFFPIEFKRMYSIFVPLTKKKYFGRVVWDQKKITPYDDFTQITKSDFSDVGNELLKGICNRILDREPFENIKKYIKGIKDRINNQEYTPYEVGIPKQIRKDIKDYKVKSDHVTSAKWSNMYLGTKFGKGSKPRMYPPKRFLPRMFPMTWISIGRYTKLPEVMQDYKPRLIIDKIKNRVNSLLALYGTNWDILFTWRLDNFL